MASDTNICLENLIGVEFGDIDIDMEVKSEQDSEEESNFISSECDEFDMEFIIPEQRRPENSKELSEFVVNNVNTSNTSPNNIDDCDIEDEPEVEIDEITVRQELVEVALDPSLLLYVNKDRNSTVAIKPPSESGNKQVDMEQLKILNDTHLLTIENKYVDSQILSVPLFGKQDVFPPLPTPNARQKDSSVTAALRKVKRKPYREFLEPLKEIDCSSLNVNNSGNIDSNRCRSDKYHKTDVNGIDTDNEENTNEDSNEIFSAAPSPLCDSDSDFKEQKHEEIRKRGRPRLKSNTYVEKFITKRKGKRRKPINKIKSVKLKRKIDKIRQHKRVPEEKRSKEKTYHEEHMITDSSKNISKCVEKVCKNEDRKVNNNTIKVKKSKKVKSKPSIFDEINMDYTVLNKDEPKEKLKRIRKRDKRSREMAAHSKPDSFDCTECGRKFKEKSHLATHARAHIDIRNFKCNKCGSLFKTKTNLFFHMKTHSDSPFTCEKCNKTYPERKTLMRHIRVVHSSQNIYSCDQCGREFKSLHNLNLHYTLHTGVKPFTCNICNKSFVYKSTYIAHMKGHDADNSFNCELCPKTYNNKAEFRRLCNHHSEARPWLCTVCGKGYPLKGTLKNHMKTHEPEKPFKCTECPKSFMKKQSFECHLKMHAGERPQFMCDQCSQSYFNVFALKRHYLKHTSERKFVCEVCHKAFWMKDALKVHMRTHSNVKLFPCIQCPKAFAHKHTLDAHLRTHLNVEPYSCNVCQKTFIHKYNLARHERQHITSTSVSAMAPSIIPPEHQAVPISIMMLPAIPPQTPPVLHSYSINAPCL